MSRLQGVVWYHHGEQGELGATFIIRTPRCNPSFQKLCSFPFAFANFASSVAALPRIVTLHDIRIVPEARGNTADPDELTLDVTAKTYRYLEEEEG